MSEELTFEQARDELERILAKLESGEAGLEDAVGLWERGEELYRLCLAKLDAAQGRVDELGNGERGRRRGRADSLRRMPKKIAFHQALNAHIGREYAAQQQYIAIAVYFETRRFPQLAAHFYRQALEERNHAMMMVQYLLDRNQAVTIPGVDAPEDELRERRRAGRARPRAGAHGDPADLRAHGAAPGPRATTSPRSSSSGS